jgi:hypothetical protein
MNGMKGINREHGESIHAFATSWNMAEKLL